MKSRSSGDATTAAAITASTAARNATSGHIPTRWRKSRETPRASTRISPTLEPRQERRRHACAVALEELDQVEMRPDRDDELGALLVREQHRAGPR